MLTLREVIRRSEAYLAQHGVDSPRLSAQLMAARGLGISRLDLFLQLDRMLDDQDLGGVRELVARRATGEPAAYILGAREFYGLDFEVNPSVLIPRPETEHAVEAVLERIDAKAAVTFADLGVGSGALAVTLAVHLPESKGLAVDASDRAVETALSNARRHGVDHRLAFARADFDRLPAPERSLDLAVSNPPYIREADYPGLSPEVRKFEPRLALVSGPTGLEAFESAVRSMACALKPGGLAVLEIGFDQGPQARSILASHGFQDVQILKDLAGCNRIVVGHAS
ncbi:MAG: release factor glutamine methyltransferase [Desulfovibrionales bacterium]|jgi:release factor glutamine methyltransferase|nr:release factor glutamine methyltransferase [Desulfovibrionales bacterium]